LNCETEEKNWKKNFFNKNNNYLKVDKDIYFTYDIIFKVYYLS